MLRSIFTRDVPDHFIPSQIAEVDINIRHRYPLRVQEAFEEQTVTDRVHIRNVQYIGDETPGRRPPAGPGRNSLLMGEADEVPHDQEIIGEAHLIDDAELIGQPFLQRPAIILIRPFPAAGVASLQSFPAQHGKIISGRHPLRDRLESRKNRPPELQLQPAFVSDGFRIRYSFRDMDEQTGHLFAALQVKLCRLHPEALRIIHCLTGADANENILHRVIFRPDIMDIVGRHQRDSGFPAQADHLLHNLLLFRQSVILDFQIVILSEDSVISIGRSLRLLVLIMKQKLGNFPSETRAQTDQAFGVLCQMFMIDPRLVMEAFEMADRTKLHQIPVAGLVLSQQNEVINRLLLP
ncbi:Uncharacterised protein [Chlamydia abortus]|nr:Uncharacterised protein [Chlamydia abortus]